MHNVLVLNITMSSLSNLALDTALMYLRSWLEDKGECYIYQIDNNNDFIYNGITCLMVLKLRIKARLLIPNQKYTLK